MTQSKIEEAITEYWGERCPDFDKDCACCQAWKEFDSLMKISDCSREWCEAVSRDSSWDSWDHYYKEMKYKLLA